MSESIKEIRKVKGPKAAIAGFKRPSDGQRIWVFKRTDEADSAAIKRVMKRNGAEGSEYELCN
jgi:hypothetical protein